MKIGIFTDTYRPSMNGVVYVTEILRRNFEALGHEVYIFAPAPGLTYKNDDPHIIRFPAVSGMVYEDFNASLFFPPVVLRRVKELDLDIIHFLTLGQVGLMGMYAAHKLDTPLVAEYTTDLFEYAEHYPMSAPAIFALGTMLPFAFKASREDLIDMMKAARPRLGVAKWNREMVKHLVTVIHQHCDVVIAHSRKSATQLKSWQDPSNTYPISIIPTGIDPLPTPTASEIADFRALWQISPDDEVVSYFGRLSAEKNLGLLIDMLAELVKWRPHAKLLFVGDFDYRPELEALAQASPVAERVIFTGRLPREHLGRAHAVTNVFVFPSLTDTQGLVVHEAALSGLPMVLVDHDVSEVLHDGENGFYCQNDPIDMAAKVRTILEDPALQKRMGRASRKIASLYTERLQCQKIISAYESIDHVSQTALERA